MNNVNEAYICESEHGEDAIKGFKVTNITARHEARIIGSPVESGRMSFDNKVIEPTVLTVKGLVHMDDFDDVHDKLVKMFINRDWEFVSIIGKGVIWNQMMLSKMPHEETNERHDVVEFTLEFTEIITDDLNSMGNGQSDKANPSSSNSTYSPTSSTGQVV